MRTLGFVQLLVKVLHTEEVTNEDFSESNIFCLQFLHVEFNRA